MPRLIYAENVFINCPFDGEYQALLEALVFAVYDCGFVARSAQEIDDAGQVRIEKVTAIIEDSRLGIHDLSRIEADAGSGFPRFNMPLELGLFLGAKRFGAGKQKQKICLILDREPYRYQQYCSDIAGQDIRAHAGDPAHIVTIVRNWLRNASRDSGVMIPGGTRMAQRYALFRAELPRMCRRLHLETGELIFRDYTTLVVEWTQENCW